MVRGDGRGLKRGTSLSAFVRGAALNGIA